MSDALTFDPGISAVTSKGDLISGDPGVSH